MPGVLPMDLQGVKPKISMLLLSTPYLPVRLGQLMSPPVHRVRKLRSNTASIARAKELRSKVINILLLFNASFAIVIDYAPLQLVYVFVSATL